MLRRATSNRRTQALPVYWIPAITEISVAGNLQNFVLWHGAPTGWFYSGNLPPRLVSITEQSNGGPTGQVVRIAPGPLSIAQAPVPAPAQAQVRASMRRRNPSNTMTARPSSPTNPFDGCCVVESEGSFIDEASGFTVSTSGTIQCAGGSAQSAYHGRQIPTASVEFFQGETGERMASIETGDATLVLPVCESDIPPPPEDDPCCYDEERMILVCPGSPVDGATITGLFEEQEDGLRTLSYIDPRDGLEKSGRLMPCRGTTRDECCYDRFTSTIQCSGGENVPVTMVSPVRMEDGSTAVIVALTDGQEMTVAVCPDSPGQCCYEVATGTLRCPGDHALNGQAVSLIAMVPQQDSSIVAVVQIPGRTEQLTIPICDDSMPDCCFDGETMTLVCNNGSINGTTAAVVTSWKASDGTTWVWATWSGGGGRVPMCSGQRCPPSFCCVNVETMRFVCPGSDINGRVANIVDIVTEDGFNWGVLASGNRVPLCGRDCPAPEICPECPGCPPGLWMSPDGSCGRPPECPPDRGCEPDCPPHPGTPIRMPNPKGAAQRKANPRPISRTKTSFVDPRGDITSARLGYPSQTQPSSIGIRSSSRLRVGQKVQFPIASGALRPAPGKCGTVNGPHGETYRCCTSFDGNTSCTVISINPFPSPRSTGRRGPYAVRNPSNDPQWKKDGHCCKSCAENNPCDGDCGVPAQTQTARVMNPWSGPSTSPARRSAGRRRGPR